MYRRCVLVHVISFFFVVVVFCVFFETTLLALLHLSLVPTIFEGYPFRSCLIMASALDGNLKRSGMCWFVVLFRVF